MRQFIKQAGERHHFVHLSRDVNFLPVLPVVKLKEKEPAINNTETVTDTDLEKADADAVKEHYLHGKPIDLEVARRVHERAARVTEEIRRVHGVVDDETFGTLIHDDDET
jgi:hypothetical protein